jgi:hypothetical protein
MVPVLPQSNFETLAMWRPLFALLFLVWLIRDKKFKFNEITFLPWDRVLGIFIFVGLVITLLFAQFPKQGLKQIVFWLNIYIFYLILINVLKSKQQIFEFIRYLIWSLTIIVTLGFTQLIGTFLTNLDTFWVYWASNITSRLKEATDLVGHPQPKRVKGRHVARQPCVLLGQGVKTYC